MLYLLLNYLLQSRVTVVSFVKNKQKDFLSSYLSLVSEIFFTSKAVVIVVSVTWYRYQRVFKS